MTFQPDPKVNCAGTAVVRLGDQDWFVPELTLRQNRVIVPRGPALSRMNDRLAGGDMDALDDAAMDNLITVVHAALTRAYPSLTRDEFEGLPISLIDLIKALPVVLLQSGFFTKGEVEGVPTKPEPRSTSTES